MTYARWFWVGSRPPVRDALIARLGPPATAPLSSVARGDLVVIDALAERDACRGMPGGHVFGAVSCLKEMPGVAVHVVVDHDDRFGPQLARFCMADGVLRWDPAAGLDVQGTGLDEPGRRDKPRGPALDRILQRIEEQLKASGRADSTLQRLLQFERQDSLMHRLQDPETGLFDGPYAAMKLDDEWKRAMRFHQPLSLLLVDLGTGGQGGDAERRELLAAAAGVFLNESRDIDVLARFSPSVFLMLLPGTGPAGAEVVGRRILAALRERLAGSGFEPACGIGCVPSADIPDRKAFLGLTEACLLRARTPGAGGLCATWQ